MTKICELRRHENLIGANGRISVFGWMGGGRKTYLLSNICRLFKIRLKKFFSVWWKSDCVSAYADLRQLMNSFICALVCFDSKWYFVWMRCKRACTSFWTDRHANRLPIRLVSKNWSIPKYFNNVVIPMQPCRRVTIKREISGLPRLCGRLKLFPGNAIVFIFIMRLIARHSSLPRKSFLFLRLHIHLKKWSNTALFSRFSGGHLRFFQNRIE